MNLNYSCKIIKSLLEWGVKEFIVCAGARNTPLLETVYSIQSAGYKVTTHFEERAASFYALGRIKALNKPVCVIVTSGTAVGELLPATMEAYYCGLPLVLLTADRPERYRNCGAPQSCEQANIYGKYASCIDLTNYQDFTFSGLDKTTPLHINVCLDAPLRSGNLTEISCTESLPTETYKTLTNEEYQLQKSELDAFLYHAKHPIVVLAQIQSHEKQAVTDFLINLGLPIYIEALSNLRSESKLAHLQLPIADTIWAQSESSDYPIDAVLKIGATPTHRIWRDLDEIRTHIKVFSLSSGKFAGTPGAKHISTNLKEFLERYKLEKFPQNLSDTAKFLNSNKNSFNELHNIIQSYPNAEQSWFYHLSQLIPHHSNIFIGNSLPIRYWDLAATLEDRGFNIQASRGLNGIDGQLSAFFGFADERAAANWGIFGDLTTLYDMAAFWVLNQRPELKVNICVINNGGGKIFSRLFTGDLSKLVENNHTHNFEKLAQFWKLDYQLVTSLDNFPIDSLASRIIEIIPDAEQTEQFFMVSKSI